MFKLQLMYLLLLGVVAVTSCSRNMPLKSDKHSDHTTELPNHTPGAGNSTVSSNSGNLKCQITAPWVAYENQPIEVEVKVEGLVSYVLLNETALFFPFKTTIIPVMGYQPFSAKARRLNSKGEIEKEVDCLNSGTTIYSPECTIETVPNTNVSDPSGHVVLEIASRYSMAQAEWYTNSLETSPLSVALEPDPSDHSEDFHRRSKNSISGCLDPRKTSEDFYLRVFGWFGGQCTIKKTVSWPEGFPGPSPSPCALPNL